MSSDYTLWLGKYAIDLSDLKESNMDNVKVVQTEHDPKKHLILYQIY